MVGSPPDIFEILGCVSKADLRAVAARAVVDHRDLAGLIRASRAGRVPIAHAAIHRREEPAQLRLTAADLTALASNGVGPFNPAAQRAANKVFSTFAQRRLFNAHLFGLRDHPGHWHLFYFDQRDAEGQHWRHGPHVHLINHLTHPRQDVFALLDELRRPGKAPRLGGSEHIRFRR